MPDSEEGNTNNINTNTHKRTFSTGPDQKSVDDKVNDPLANVDVPPPTKKTKLEGDDTEIITSSPDDGDELIPLKNLHMRGSLATQKTSKLQRQNFF